MNKYYCIKKFFSLDFFFFFDPLTSKEMSNNNKGIDFSNAKRYDDALTCCNEALEINPNLADATCLNNRGILLRQMGKKEEALCRTTTKH